MNYSQPVREGRKIHQVIRGAATIFLRDGYAGASVDDIARAAGVSKATLYSYFPHKGLMFQQAMQAEVAALDFALDLKPGLDPDQGVPRIAAQIAAWLVDPHLVLLYRVHVAEASRFPALSESFHDTVMRVLQDSIRPWLDRWTRSGSLDIEDTGMALRQLIALAGAALRDDVLLGREQAATRSSVQGAADRAAALFLRAHSPRLPRTMMGNAAGR